MKLSNNTIKLLKSFTSINNSIFIKQSETDVTRVRVLGDDKEMYAEMEIPERIENTVCLYDVSSFLNVVGSFEEPEITFKDTHVIVSQGRSRSKITYANPETITYPKKEYTLQDTELSFTVPEKELQKLLNISKILSLGYIRMFSSEEGKVVLKAQDIDNSGSNSYEFEVEGITLPKEYTLDAKKFMKVYPGYYKFSLYDNFTFLENVSLPENVKYLIPYKAV